MQITNMLQIKIKIALKNTFDLLQNAFNQSHLIIVKLFHFEHIFNKIESLFKSFIHEHVVGGRHVCYLQNYNIHWIMLTCDR